MLRKGFIFCFCLNLIGSETGSVVIHPSPPGSRPVSADRGCLRPDYWFNPCGSVEDACSLKRNALRVGACLFWPLGVLGGCVLGCIEGCIRIGPEAVRKERAREKRSLAELKEAGLGWCDRHLEKCLTPIAPCLFYCYAPIERGCKSGGECCIGCCTEICFYKGKLPL